MFAKRIIPCLDCQDGRVVKGVSFLNLRDAGDPGELASMYNRESADELVLLDISASTEGRATLMDTVDCVARRLFVPLTVGGGVRTLADARRLFAAGADKVAVNTAAVETPGLISELAARFGRQAVVVAIDARRVAPAALAEGDPSLGRGCPSADGRVRGSFSPATTSTDAATIGDGAWRVFTHGGGRETQLDALEWARRVEALGAGEVLLTSMDADGTQSGFDCELTRAVASALRIPVIASGGAGSPEHLAEVFTRGAADAAIVASILHFGAYSIRSLKSYLRGRGVPVRLEADS